MARLPVPSRIIRRPWPVFAVIALAALLVLGACMSELPQVGPVSDIGVVEGRVTESSLGVAATVHFSYAADDRIEANVTVLADSTGWYHAELPVGAYNVRLGFPNRYVSASSDADTVKVGRCVRRRDFTRTRAQVAITVPAVFEGAVAYLSAGGPGYRASSSMRVKDGIAAFDLRLLPPAKYAMRFRPGNNWYSFLLPGTEVAAEADTLDARAGLATYALDLRARHASLAGTVTGSWQLSPDNMTIEAVGLDGQTVADAECAADGTFRLDTLMPKPVKIVTRHNSIENWHGGTSLATATVFNLQPGDHVENLAITEGGITIRFQGPGQRVPLQHSVVLQREDGGNIYLMWKYGDPLRITNLPGGRYRLRVGGYCFQEPWQPQWYDVATDVDGAVPIDVVAGAVQSITMELRAGGSISGRVTNGGGPVSYAYNVYVGDGTGADLCDRSIYTDGDQLLLDGLPDGDYCLSLFDRVGRWWYPGTRDLAQATRLTIAGGNALTGLVWPLATPVMSTTTAGGAR